MTTNILDNIDLRTLGELLQQARKKCGMTQSDAANIIDVARTTIVAIEKGERRIKATELIKLARAYGRSVSDFVRSRPVIQPFEMQFRAAYQRSEGEEVQIEPAIQQLEELCRNYLELEEIMSAPLPQNYPPECEVTNMPLKASAESIAVAERQRLGLGDGPILRLRDILEQDVGLRIFYLKMPPKYSGIYSYDERLGGCIAINANHPEERRRWSLAHEYLHFLAHRRKAVLEFEGQYQRVPESERLADTFPKYFLMPTSGLFRRFNDMCRTHGKFTPTHLFTLAHYYGVSIEALAYRLEEMELVRTGTWERLRDRGLKVRKVQQELGLEDIPQRTDTIPLHYQHLAIEALDQGLITESRFSDFLNVDRLEARRIAETLREHSSGMMEEASHFDLINMQE
ncbi:MULTISPECIES: XRE family transcriptional regulator [unclassified Microcoleus]|uniref:XRE family transcriptional regulator n=1 Tax=unclassified Microcoleus TaxID=2642155 RepID=UPI001E02E641|nr:MULTISPECIES: XRE family transcriptional regulator [unclassified Microcoleus]MCC3421395.1 XRE family transcriptional regulator [Microcoleus sp. PH2017_07_MST_O_A]MCC3465211.1 XRE family transcriptional regulator [Microcoleus sp. PH2017_06_SFM_O_A]MCC3511013.1 XRE family transcriptional regulator [Microcoleus sp. PH2017_17_BER_D_A]TAE11397.1 MAG: ImmA/IrrE family metallo-endopeptidase [Oscillatoriales cyanobacterium]MCC3413499.1 XRE family transcriptional regulator [Microcoleus sp. PH2017_02